MPSFSHQPPTIASTIERVRKLRELRNERDFLRDQLGKFDQGRRKMTQEAREREELLARRHAVSQSGHVMLSYSLFSPSTRARRRTAYRAVMFCMNALSCLALPFFAVRSKQALPSSVMDSYAEEGNSLLRSRRMVGDYMQQGQASLASLVEQRSRLKVG